MTRACCLCIAWLLSLSAAVTHGDEKKPDTSRGDAMIAAYFKAEAAKLTGRPINRIDSLDEWEKRRVGLRRQLFDMLGLRPLPKKTPLKPVITGKLDHEKFTVEKLHFQSRPGLYVTGNLYLPKGVDKPAPAILYVCGHARRKQGDRSLGNKTAYQHHGEWFARHGYVCLTIDSLQLGEIEGTHHGTYSYDMWWWNARGYTPAGVEAWNCIRALDYLETRPEVDKTRLGVTGRSGGGAYSWWIAALDERIKAAVPVAGITDLRNHITDGGSKRFHDGVIEGHCDCMYMLNTYRWDFATVAALVAPRPLLITNSDKDSIFPLDGVVRLHEQTRRIYRLYDADDKLGLHVTEGPHKDTQELRVGAFSWFNRFLKDERPLIDTPAEKLFEEVELAVFDALPTDSINGDAHESFVKKAGKPTVPSDKAAWDSQRDAWMKALRTKVFRGWPAKAGGLDVQPAFDAVKDGVRLRAYDFTSQGPFRLRLFLMHRDGLKDADLVVVNVLGDADWNGFLAQARVAFAEALAEESAAPLDAEDYAGQRGMLLKRDWVMAYVAPRGVGPTAWSQNKKKQTQHRRRFMLIGQTLDGMRVWDIRRAVQALRELDGFGKTQLWLQSKRQMAGVTLYASLFEPDVYRLDLWELPASHRQGPVLLNVLRHLDTPQALAMAAERSRVVLYQAKPDKRFRFVSDVTDALNWPDKQFTSRAVPGE